MTIDNSTVKKIANLARIEVSKKEEEALSKELHSIFDWIEQLKDVDISDIEPLSNVAEITLREREDKVDFENTIEDTLGNAPEKYSHYFSVPKVIE